MNLFPYQERIVEAVRSSKGSRPLVVMPCGAGKTVTGIACVMDEPVVIWAAHRKELLDQAQATASRMGKRIQTYTVQALLAMPVKPTGFLVWDECHHVMAEEWSQLALHYPRILGLSATPERADGSGLGAIFDDIIVGVGVSELISLGRLVGCDVVRPPKLLKPGQIAQDPVKTYDARCKGQKAILFAPNVPSAMQYAAAFGTRAAFVHSGMAQRDRDAVVAAYKAGRFQILTNVMVLTEGFDDPETSVVILARGCSTQGTYIQMTMRAMRASPGKKKATILDLRGVSWIHGDPAEDRVYSLEGRGIRRSGEKVDARYCAVCGALRTGATCSDCGNVVEPAAPPKVVNAKLERMVYRPGATEEEKIAKLRGWLAVQRAKNYKPNWPYVRFSVEFGHPVPPALMAKARRTG